MIRVVIESPFSGGSARNWLDALTFGPARRRWRNLRYARAAMRDSLERGEAPIGSHLIYTQPGILRDADVEERQWGIDAGLAWAEAATLRAVYVDVGFSIGMDIGVEHALSLQQPVEARRVAGWRDPWWCRGQLHPKYRPRVIVDNALEPRGFEEKTS